MSLVGLPDEMDDLCYHAYKEASRCNNRKYHSIESNLSSSAGSGNEQVLLDSETSSTTSTKSSIKCRLKSAASSCSQRTSTSESGTDSFSSLESESDTDEDSFVNIDEMPKHIRKLICLGLWNGNYKRPQHLQELYDLGILMSSSQSEGMSDVNESADSISLSSSSEAPAYDYICTQEQNVDTSCSLGQDTCNVNEDIQSVETPIELESHVNMTDSKPSPAETNDEIKECFSEFDVKVDTSDELEMEFLESDTSLNFLAPPDTKARKKSSKKSSDDFTYDLSKKVKRRKSRKELNELYIRACSCQQCAHYFSNCINAQTIQLCGMIADVNQNILSFQGESVTEPKCREGDNPLSENPSISDTHHKSAELTLHSRSCQSKNKCCRKLFYVCSSCKQAKNMSNDSTSKHCKSSTIEDQDRQQRLKVLLQCRQTIGSRLMAQVHSYEEQSFDIKRDNTLILESKNSDVKEQTPMQRTEVDHFQREHTNSSLSVEEMSHRNIAGKECKSTYKLKKRSNDDKKCDSLTKLSIKNTSNLWKHLTLTMSQAETGLQRRETLDKCNKIISEITRRRFSSLTINPRIERNRKLPSLFGKGRTRSLTQLRKEEVKAFLPEIRADFSKKTDKKI